jgi:hypothetical protein
MPPPTSQILFRDPDGMQIQWSQYQPGMFDSEPLVVPGRYNFGQAGIYRLKLTNIPGYPGVELYPTLEVAPAKPRTEAFLAHAPIPVQLTIEDFDQVLAGNFVTKVIYLPDPAFQELAVASGVEALVSHRLDPGVDPVIEADKRGSILAIIRVGNKDLQAPGMSMPQMVGGPMMMGPGGPPGMPGGPQWGIPSVGTPIGLPGPPHIPLGGPAGLQRHSISNHTHYNIPGPTERLDIHVKETPGYSYPKPVTDIHIHETDARNGLGGGGGIGSHHAH